MKLPEHLKTFITGSLITIGGNLVIGLSNYLVRRTMVFQLSELEYGCFYGAFSLVLILTAIADLGLVNTGTVLISENRQKANIFFSAVLYIKMLIAGGVSILFYVFRGKIATHYLGGMGSNMLVLLSFFIFLVAVSDAFNAYFYGNKFFRSSCIFRSITAFLLWGAVILLTKNGSGSGAAAAYIIAYLTTIIIQFFWISRRDKICSPFLISRSLYGKIIKFSGPLAVIACIQIILANLDSVMLTYLCGPETVAIYNVALPITQLLLSVLIFATVFLPIATDLAKAEKYNQLKKYAYYGLFITGVGLPLLFWICKLGGEFLITLLFKSSYAEPAARLLPWLMCGYWLFAAGAFIMQILIAMRRVKVLLVIVISTLCCNIILNYCLIKRFAELGASLSAFLSYLFFTVAVFCLFAGVMKNKKG